LNGDDLRHDPLQVRKATLASILAKASSGIGFNEHIAIGPTVFAHACKRGLEGIVSKRKDSTYRSGRLPDWLKMKNSDAPAVKREAEEDWGKCQCAWELATLRKNSVPRCLGKSQNPLFTSRLVAVMQHYLEEFGWGVSILHNVSEKRRKS
jgi:ATP dependent DNA ligase domain